MNTTQIVKSKTVVDYTVVKNLIFKDVTISWAAKGLYVHLMSLPPNWVIFRRVLSENSKDGYQKTNTAFKELIEAGYVLSVEMRNAKGHFKGYNYIIYDEPIKDERLLAEDRAQFTM